MSGSGSAGEVEEVGEVGGVWGGGGGGAQAQAANWRGRVRVVRVVAQLRRRFMTKVDFGRGEMVSQNSF